MRPPHETPSQPTPPAAAAAPPTLRTSPPADAQPTSDLSPPDTAPSGAATPLLPAPAGRYQLGEEIGRGGMGEVHRARDPQLGRELAVKVLRGDSHTSPELLRRFVEEAQVCGQLQHPGIVPVHDLGRLEDGRPFFAMKLVKGRTLAELLNGRAGPAADLPRYLGVFEQVCQAVAYAHSKGVIHRDLKPANVMVGTFGEVQVMDWGLAKVLRPQGSATAAAETAASVICTVRSACGEETGDGQAMGTPAYMAPEQARGEVESLDERCDVFGLGAILCQVLTGAPPFPGRSAEAHARAMCADLGDAFARLEGCGADAELVRLARGCLAADPAGRPRDARAVAAAVTAYRQAVQERLRQAELGRAAEQARARAEQRARRLRAGLAMAVLMVLLLAAGGGLWAQRQQAERREETARLEGRAWQAVEAALEKVAVLQQQGRWKEARAALEGAQGLLGDSAPKDLVERLRQARSDADMVAELEEIRLRLSAGGGSPKGAPLVPDSMYSAAFRDHGIDLVTLAPGEAATRIRSSAIRETLLAFLHDWLFWVSDENRATLLAVLDGSDDDGWRHAFREALVEKDMEKLKALASAPEAPDQPPVVLSGLAGVMLADRYKDEALAHLREAQQRHPGDFWINYLLGLFWAKDRPQEAVGYFRAAVAIRPTSDQAYTMLGRALRDSGDAEGAIAAFRQSVALNPNPEVAKDLTTALSRKGGLEEARAAWEKILELDPPDHDSWYGYAELCLFLGREDDYRRARRDLLRRFGATTEPFVAERTGRACLLMPATGEELRQAVALAQCAVAAERPDAKWAHPYFLFARGLAEYRQGEFDRAVTTMRGDASGVLGPAPRLVLAMALHRSGKAAEARKMLAAAVLAHDWRANLVRDRDGWMYHVLRREAEGIILPNLPAFTDGKYQPQDNDERLAMLGACQFTNRTRAMARLYADAFAASPPLADDLGAGHRYNAARAAARAGCGHGKDAPGLGEAEGKKWRDQARQWLRAELAARVRALDTDPAARLGVREALTRWQKEPDLAGVRDRQALAALPAGERGEWEKLWADVADLLRRLEAAKPAAAPAGK
jgi:eukaryotic-like serine/threonine-protein kinase